MLRVTIEESGHVLGESLITGENGEVVASVQIEESGGHSPKVLHLTTDHNEHGQVVVHS
jgi:hypothetical protein